MRDTDDDVCRDYCWKCATELEIGTNRLVRHGVIAHIDGSDLIRYCPNCERVASILRAPSCAPDETEVGKTYTEDEDAEDTNE